MERSIDELIELLNDKDDFVVEDAVGELELRADEAIDPLIDALSSRKKSIRLHAATLLGAINDPKAIPALVDTLHDNNKLVRREASTALSRMGEPAVDPLIETLNDEDWRVRGQLHGHSETLVMKKLFLHLKNCLTMKAVSLKKVHKAQ